MFAPTTHIIFQEKFWLCPQRAIYWESEQTLILSDLHFGKTGHFRKNGIPIPQKVYQKDIQKLTELLQYFQPKQVIAVGDLFHSSSNLELEHFLKWRSDFPNIKFILVKGNHDILNVSFYKKADIELKHCCWEYNSTFSFVHDMNDIPKPAANRFYFSGHIHPGIRMEGIAKQSILLPCFYQTGNQFVLPAFSEFTGLFNIKPQRSDHVFAIVENQILHLQEC